MSETAIVVLVPALLAYANGGNDVSKGIATLVGSSVTSYRRAILWGTAWTALGAVVASVASGAMLATFGRGLVAEGVASSFLASAGALFGAAAWVSIATRASLPVSTTHALVGSVIGASVTAYGASGIAWAAVGTKVFVPLIASPLAAFILARLTSRSLARTFGASGAPAACLCVESRRTPRLAWVGGGSALAATPLADVSVTSGATVLCRESKPNALRFTADHLHWLSSGAVSFARGLNDAPKIVGLALAAALLAADSSAVTTALLFTIVTLGVVLGSLAAGRRVTRVLAEDVTPMDPREGLAANLVTASLVTAGAVWGLPMSTTHVSSGAIVGVGAERGSLNRRTARDIGMAWVVTLPAAALLGALAYETARLVLP